MSCVKKLVLALPLIVWGVCASSVAMSHECHVWAYTIDKDPNGVNIRSAPSPTSRIIGKIPYNPEHMHWKVKIKESKGGWVRIEGYNSPDSKTIKTDGWVFSELLGTSLSGSEIKLYSAPTPNASSQRLPPIAEIVDVTVLGCKGEWLEGALRKPTKEMLEHYKRESETTDWFRENKIYDFLKELYDRDTDMGGWIEPANQCPNPWTTCV